MSDETSRRVTPEVLTAAEARELRRRLRKAEAETKSGSPPEVKRALRVLRRVARNLERNQPRAAMDTLLHGFGAIMLRKLLEKGQTRP